MGDRRKNSTLCPSLVLGTAQLGLRYGIANTTGMPAESTAYDLIAAAVAEGVTEIDTARAYGASERRIGIALETAADSSIHVITKLAPLTHLPSAAEAVAAAQASLAASRAALSRSRLDTLLLHRAEDRLNWNGAVWNLLRSEQIAGRIGRLGVSAQSPAEALQALDDPSVVHLQFPYNVLDSRWHDAGVVDKLQRRPDVTVHTRSTLLQGLLTLPQDAPWPGIDAQSTAKVRDSLKVLARDFRDGDVIDLCVAFVRSHAWIDGVVMGMETIGQLRANLELFSRPPLDQSQVAAVRAAFPRLPSALLNPAEWPAVPSRQDQ